MPGIRGFYSGPFLEKSLWKRRMERSLSIYSSERGVSVHFLAPTQPGDHQLPSEPFIMPSSWESLLRLYSARDEACHSWLPHRPGV
jgi:hypothetical protein